MNWKISEKVLERYWVRYAIVGIPLFFFAVFGPTNALVFVATMFLFAEMNYLKNKQRWE